MMKKLRKTVGLVFGVSWFLSSTIGGAAILDFALREHPDLAAPFLPMLIIGWIGVCFLLRWMLSRLLRFVFQENLQSFLIDSNTLTGFPKREVPLKLTGVDMVRAFRPGEAILDWGPASVIETVRIVNYSLVNRTGDPRLSSNFVLSTLTLLNVNIDSEAHND